MISIAPMPCVTTNGPYTAYDPAAPEMNGINVTIE